MITPSIRFEMHQNASEQQTLESLLAIEAMITSRKSGCVLKRQATGAGCVWGAFLKQPNQW